MPQPTSTRAKKHGCKPIHDPPWFVSGAGSKPPSSESPITCRMAPLEWTTTCGTQSASTSGILRAVAAVLSGVPRGRPAFYRQDSGPGNASREVPATPPPVSPARQHVTYGHDPNWQSTGSLAKTPSRLPLEGAFFVPKTLRGKDSDPSEAPQGANSFPRPPSRERF